MTIAVDLGRKATKQANKISVLSIFEWPFYTGFTEVILYMLGDYVPGPTKLEGGQMQHNNDYHDDVTLFYYVELSRSFGRAIDRGTQGC